MYCFQENCFDEITESLTAGGLMEWAADRFGDSLAMSTSFWHSVRGHASISDACPSQDPCDLD